MPEKIPGLGRRAPASGGAAYGKLAAALYEPALGRILAPMRAAMAAMLREAGCRNAADICCGPGGLGCFLRRCGIYAPGLDRDGHMLGAAKSRDPDRPFALADAACLPFASSSLDAAVISLALHEMPPGAAEAALAEARRVARMVLLADYRLAERNIDLPARMAAAVAERLIGGEHWRAYQRFMRDGGLEGLLYRQKARILQRRNALGGAAAAIMIAGEGWI